MPSVREAVLKIDGKAFAERHGGHKESLSEAQEYLLPCRLCGSSRLRWSVTRTTWICWGCNATGHTLDLIRLYERTDFEGAVRYVLEGYVGGDAPTELSAHQVAVPVPRGRLKKLRSRDWPFGVDVLGPRPEHARAWQYLAYRGLDASYLEGHQLGFGRWGRIQDYLVFPVVMDGALVYWQARSAWDYQPGDRPPKGYRKTLNPRNEPGLATAQEVLFNWDRAAHREHVVVCEGPVDALKVGPHAVALLGKVGTPPKLERLLRMRARRYTVYLDRGAEEREAAQHIAAQLSGFAPTYVALPPEGQDAGALTREQNAAVIGAAEPYRAGQLSRRGLAS